jgi:NADH:ubiquinone oxidoreductase subunit 6 (subunit J)
MKFTMKRGGLILNLNLLQYLFTALTLIGAIGAVFFRHFLYAILFLLMALFCICGLLSMMGLEILSAALFWQLGTTSILVLLHIFFILRDQNNHKPPRRLLPGKFFFLLVVFNAAASLIITMPAFHTSKIHPSPIDKKMLLELFQTEHAFAIFLLLGLSPFIFISTLLLIRQDKNRNAP